MPEPIDTTTIQERTLNTIQKSLLENDVVEALREIYDPELPVNIYDLGLIYDIDVADNADVLVTMTLTSPACPVAESLPGEVQDAVNQVAGVRDGRVNLVWDPPYSLDRMPEHIQLELGLM
ncbi:MAG: DUF59 domain-containing protein [Armatimonadetes bacterium]|nr:DUF59 domain-containing protein [Armatimonadota bacterium]